LIGVILHHYIKHRKLIDWEDVDSHEFIIAFLLGLLLGSYFL
jgi:hypothetical protein